MPCLSAIAAAASSDRTGGRDDTDCVARKCWITGNRGISRGRGQMGLHGGRKECRIVLRLIAHPSALCHRHCRTGPNKGRVIAGDI